MVRVSCACYGKIYPSVPYVGSIEVKRYERNLYIRMNLKVRKKEECPSIKYVFYVSLLHGER